MSKGFSRVAVIGLGYIGLPTAAIIASRGLDVVGVDVSEHAVNTINQGKIHIVEPDLDMVVQAAVTTGKLKATLEAEEADVFIIAVPTPFKEGHTPDLSYIEAACKAISPVIKKGDLVILESTSPVGATEQVAKWLSEMRPDLTNPLNSAGEADLSIAHCPERVLPGRVLEELVSNDRIIGGISPACSEKALALYKTFVRGECLLTNARTAEMAKLTENAFRDVNIAFANELSIICDELKINVWELISLANRHPRVNILNPGPGVGGHCIAVDPWFIVDSAPETARIIRTAREINDGKPGYVKRQVTAAADEFKRPVICCLGLAFKANIDDLRESPALAITNDLAEQGIGEILAVEPNISALPKGVSDKVTLTSLHDALERCNVIVVLVDHDEFKAMPIEVIKNKIVIDTRGIV
ncbi:UDP-N-acetyl-D-mannosamine dehydrogenase [Alteromonas flava]|uniref:UDP-N-acetyl-D-mannosamine dehydrogenase n=1 Tax=Alteromonas flava TaxID=2048003 RepID=UPI000C292F74|nr:UDP-N-acetyl-D-mannosamine dehydrogenase [Alteromonas flava]